MRLTIFEKDGKVCYSTFQGSGTTSAKEESLIAKGWRYVGNLWGRDVSSSNIPTMTKVLAQKR